MTTQDKGREPYSHDAPPREWGCVIETPEGRVVRTASTFWPWVMEHDTSSSLDLAISDVQVAEIGWRLPRPEPARGLHPAARRLLEAHRESFQGVLRGETAVPPEVWRATRAWVAAGHPIDAPAERDEASEAQVLPGEREYAEQSEPAMVPATAIRAALAGGVRCSDWPDEAIAVADVVAERDALRRIVGEVDLALSGAPASGQWGPRALSVHDLMSAIDADDYSDADDAVRCAQAMAAVVRDVARERIAAEQDGGAS